MKNIKLIIEYDGTHYSGWQRQKNGTSIEETVEQAIMKILNEDIKLIGSSRTDAGVHSKGQTVNFTTISNIPVDRLPAAFNSQLPKDIAVTKAEEVSLDFHSRYSSRGKLYTYTILNRKSPPAIFRNFVAHCPFDLNYDLMLYASRYFIGTYDFSAFKSTGSSVKTSIRTISLLELVKKDDTITMFIEADGFLYNMVRIIAGTLMDVGRGRIPSESIPEIIFSKDRKRAGQTAPAAGLCLEKVYY
jgi:tRNA pseudouridine38-40 synthase